jgi:carboxypeptidase Q
VVHTFSRWCLVVVLAVVTLAAPPPGPLGATPAGAQQPVDEAVFERIRDEGLTRSHIDTLAWTLTDVIGPRLTGSTGMLRANEWTAEQMRAWGLADVRVEPWGEFGRGWEIEHAHGRLLEPFVQPLVFLPLAWTGSTPGPVEGPARLVDPRELAAGEVDVDGAWVLIEAHRPMAPEFEPPAQRLELGGEAPTREGGASDEPVGSAPFQGWSDQGWSDEEWLEVTTAAEAAGAAGVLLASSRAFGVLRVDGVRGARAPDAPVPLPQLVLSHDQYGTIHRNLERDVPVRLEVDVRTRFLTEDLAAYNTFADLPGSDLAHELVIIGAHLDSWHGGTGATDNAAGVVVMMEAMRILAALELEPRRTIRIGLWSGEELGLLGSRQWVEANEELWPRISAYLNLDNGTGRIRGMRTQGNEAAVAVFQKILEPFRDLGVEVVTTASAGGTDHLSFHRHGIPGFNYLQDPIEYGSRSHHTSADTFDRLVLDDLKQAAVVVAATAYHLAVRDEPLPRPVVDAATGGGH